MNRTLLLNEKQIDQRINRLAWQIYEDNGTEKEIVVAGIMKNGFMVAERITRVLEKISGIKVHLTEVNLDKHSQTNNDISISFKKDFLESKVVILVDDVLNSGKTMMYALKPFLAADIKKIRTVVLIDRNHKRFPVSADFTGLSLATTHHEHVSVEFEKQILSAWLS